MTRIIAGAARGRRLAVPAKGTRPTSDRVRESLFSVLDSALLAGDRGWQDISVLDLYAGSGALGLEALSRGARSVVLVEKSAAAVRVLDARSPARVVAMSSAADLVLIDPPYEVPADDIATTLAGLLASGWIRHGADVVVERSARDVDSPLPVDWEEPRRREYGDTALWYGRAAADPEEGS